MELYLLRHGDAGAHTTPSKDGERALTQKGKDDVAAVVKLARAGGARPDVVLTSPLRRAKETAEVAQKIFGGKRLLETKALLPDSSPEMLCKELSTLESADRVLLAGHEPGMGRLVQFLLRVKLDLDFKKGAMIRIEMTPDGGVLRWMITPRLVRRKTSATKKAD